MAATSLYTIRLSIADGSAPPSICAELIWEHVRMAYLIERRAQILYISASLVNDKGKRRKIVIESRPEFAIVTLQGMKEKYPISWEQVFEEARRRHAENLRIEAKPEAEMPHRTKRKRPRG